MSIIESDGQWLEVAVYDNGRLVIVVDRGHSAIARITLDPDAHADAPADIIVPSTKEGRQQC